MPESGAKIPIEHVFVPSGYTATRGTSKVDDWALVRIPDAHASGHWFRTGAWSDADLRGFQFPTATGFPWANERCAASPLTSGRCGGYQYRARATQIRLSRSYIDTGADWQQGQSGGPVFGTMSGETRRVAMGIIHSSREDLDASIALRINATIWNKVCEQTARSPSARFRMPRCAP